MTPYLIYVNTKNKLCISYHGIIGEFILQLLFIKPKIQEKYPEFDLYISCKDEIFERLKTLDNKLIPMSDIEKKQFINFYNINHNHFCHPIEKFIDENHLELNNIKRNSNISLNKKCVITTTALAPFKGLSPEQVEKAINLAKSKGLEILMNEEVENPAWVIGCENELFYKKAIAGSNVILIQTNKGNNVFKKLFPTEKIFFC